MRFSGAGFSGAGFSLAFLLSYPCFLALDWHLFLFYPLAGQWSLHPLEPSAGPAMQWYGLMASSGLAGILAAVILPGVGLSPRLLYRVAAASAMVAMMACIYLMAHFFV